MNYPTPDWFFFFSKFKEKYIPWLCLLEGWTVLCYSSAYQSRFAHITHLHKITVWAHLAQESTWISQRVYAFWAQSLLGCFCITQRLLPKAVATQLGMVTRAGSRSPAWIALSGMRTTLPSSAEGKDGEVGGLAAHGSFAVEGMSRQVCVSLWHFCPKCLGGIRASAPPLSASRCDGHWWGFVSTGLHKGYG